MELQSCEFDEALAKVLAGKMVPTGLKEEELSKDLLWRMSGAGRVEKPYFVQRQWFDKEKGTFDQRLYRPTLFLKLDGMGDRFSGSGVILAGEHLFSFAFCEHDWDESGANHGRGWHPRKCRKCKFDASIDSGD